MAFVLNETQMVVVHNYTYLEITFVKCGSLKAAARNLADKANKALFKLNNTFSANIINPKNSGKLYEAVVKHVAIYACAVWITYSHVTVLLAYLSCYYQ